MGRTIALLTLLALAACNRGGDADPQAGGNGAVFPVPEATPLPPPATDEPAVVPDPAPPTENGTVPAETPDPARPGAGAATQVTSATRIPAGYHGRWAASARDCARPHEGELTVTPTALRFWESEGEVQRVSAAGPRRVDVTGRFTGEGQSWTRTHRMALDASGERLTVSTDGAGTVRVRCD